MISRFVPAEYTASCEKALEEIANRAKVRLFEEYKVDLKFGEVAYTDAVGYIQETAAYLRRHPEETIDIQKLLEFSTVKSESDTGEKAGNIVPKVEMLENFSAEEGTWQTEEIKFEASDSERAVEEIANHTRVRLYEENKVELKMDHIVYKTAVIFIQEIAAYLRRHPNEEIEIASLIKFRAVKSDDDSIVFIAELGERFKLGVKNDEVTEEDEDEDF